MIGKWHLGSDPVGFDRHKNLPGIIYIIQRCLF